MGRKIELVINPVSGSGLATTLVENYIKPLLESSVSNPSQLGIRRTEGVADGVRIGNEVVLDYLSSSSSCLEGEYLDIVLVGGDGTTHEVLNGFYIQHQLAEGGRLPRMRLAIVPAGTANALFSAMFPKDWTQEVQQLVASAKSATELSDGVLEVMLRSVRALAAEAETDGRRLEELPLMLNRLELDDNGKGEKVSISHLVTSHALHASILHDADTPQMRSQYSGIERFKIAAQQNATRWIQGSLTLHPLPLPHTHPSSPGSTGGEGGGGGVLKYSPSSKRFEPLSKQDELRGPFLYLTALVTDRLESSFIPAPLSSSFKQPDGLPRNAVDLVLIRPTRDPCLKEAEAEEAGVRFATTSLGEITKGMYTQGSHIDLTYAEGQGAVEYLRCSGYTFVPEKQAGDNANLVCTDGFISSSSRTEVRRWNPAAGAKREEEEEGVRLLHPPLVWR